MGVRIDDMNLPETCWDCPFSQTDPYWCSLTLALIKAGKAPEHVTDADGVPHHNGHLSRHATGHGQHRPAFCPMKDTESITPTHKGIGAC